MVNLDPVIRTMMPFCFVISKSIVQASRWPPDCIEVPERLGSKHLELDVWGFDRLVKTARESNSVD